MECCEKKTDIATDISGAVNEASIDKSREGREDEEEKGDIEMKTKE